MLKHFHKIWAEDFDFQYVYERKKLILFELLT